MIRQTTSRALVALVLFLALSLVGPVFGQADISTSLGVKNGIPAADYSGDFTGDALDLINYGASMVVISTGSGTFSATDGYTVALTQCASSTGTFTAVAAGDVIGVTPNASGTILSIVASQTTPQVAKIGYVGRYRYVKLSIDEIGTASSTPISGVVIGGRPKLAPVPSGD